MNKNDLRHKIMGCWLGKAVGGTLGQPYEGCDGPLNLTYYDPVPTDMIPNDDLDLQVLWACLLDTKPNPVINRNFFGNAWLNHVEFPWDEYGVAIRNLKNGIQAPFSGSYDNWFKDGLGAAIRSEIWACMAPGKPDLAAAFAFEDACVDHDGDGIYAEQFLAALESMAFVESDIDKLIDAGLEVIPSDSRLACAIRDTREWCSQEASAMEVRDKILQKYGNENFTDVVMNIPFIILSLILGKGNFSETICLAVNCGRDADCTAASAGAIMGLISPDSIDEKWLKPIGRKLVINEGITGISPPATLDGFTDLIISLKDKVELSTDSTDSFPTQKLTVETAIFSDWFAQDSEKFSPEIGSNTESSKLESSHYSMPASTIPSDSLYMMRFKFQLNAATKVRVMFNTNANSRVWLDGKFAFGREGGRMAPSFHRAPINQFIDIELGPGEHEVIAGISPFEQQDNIEWVIGVGDFESKQWLQDVFI